MDLEEYRNINNSFKRICVYRIGNDAGFFSEINNMLMAMVFCVENQLQFRLCSTNSNFGKDIWKDYLLPFTRHSTKYYHILFNERPYIHKRPHSFTIEELFSIKKTLAKLFLTQDIWPYIRDKNKYNAYYQVKSPYINGGLIEVASILIKCVWKYNLYAGNRIQKLIDSLQLPSEYAAIFIRRGDKYTETSYVEVKRYIEKVNSLTQDKKYPIFIGSDDYNTIQEAKYLFPNQVIYCFENQSDKGYFMEDFINNTIKEQKLKIVNLLAQVEIFRKAKYFVGTYSTNVGVFVGMARNCYNSYDVNNENWALW